MARTKSNLGKRNVSDPHVPVVPPAKTGKSLPTYRHDLKRGEKPRSSKYLTGLNKMRHMKSAAAMAVLEAQKHVYANPKSTADKMKTFATDTANKSHTIRYTIKTPHIKRNVGDQQVPVRHTPKAGSKLLTQKHRGNETARFTG